MNVTDAISLSCSMLSLPSDVSCTQKIFVFFERDIVNNGNYLTFDSTVKILIKYMKGLKTNKMNGHIDISVKQVRTHMRKSGNAGEECIPFIAIRNGRSRFMP